MLTIDQVGKYYPAGDAVHGFEHVLRVAALAEQLAQAEGADLEIVQAAALLHDAQPNPEDDGRRANHHLTSAEFAGKLLAAEGWPAERVRAVEHCILAHRFRDDSQQPGSLEAKILFDADKLDAIGAIGAARAIGYALQAGQPFYSEPSAEFLKTGKTIPGEAHSAYHEYIFKLGKLKERLYTASGRKLAEARHARMEDFFNGLKAEIEQARSENFKTRSEL